MSDSSRALIVRRRGKGIGDLSKITNVSGPVNWDTPEFMNLLEINNSINMGLGTETEIGLTPSRFPIRVLLDPQNRNVDTTDCVVKYWKVVNAAGVPIPFTGRDPGIPGLIGRLYDAYPDLDGAFWRLFATRRNYTFNRNEGNSLLSEQVYTLASIINASEDQRAQLTGAIADVITAYERANVAPFIRIGNDQYLVGAPHGVNPRTPTGMAANTVMAAEFALTYEVNYRNLYNAYPDVSTGLITAMAYSIAVMFREGLYESHAGREYHTIIAAPSANGPKKFSITEVNMSSDAPGIVDLTVGTDIDISSTSFEKKLFSVGPACLYMAGLNHYTLNHTTGGSEVSGGLLAALMMYRLWNEDETADVKRNMTDCIYEALHPVNKRAIANLFFGRSKVYSWGRNSGASAMQRLTVDSFLSIRSKPAPAGAHKAYLCSIALRRLCISGMNVFLPWNSEIANARNIIMEVVNGGARAHVGSHYYTGLPVVSTSNALDTYMPELAAYIQTLCTRDTIAYSPHFSVEVAARASSSWVMLMKSLKSRDIDVVDMAAAAQYLRQAGTVTSTFDPNDPNTWPASIVESKETADLLGQIYT